MPEDLDSFDKLLIALSREGFTLPGTPVIHISKVNDEDPRGNDREGWQQNRSALITAMTNSEWIAQ